MYCYVLLFSQGKKPSLKTEQMGQVVHELPHGTQNGSLDVSIYIYALTG